MKLVVPEYLRFRRDTWIVIIVLLVLGLAGLSKSYNKKNPIDHRETIIETILVKQVCVGTLEKECITLPEPKLMNIIKRKDDKDPTGSFIISLEERR